MEDDAALSSFIRKGLEAEHHAVDVANDGNQGRALAMEVAYDLMVLDLNLPGMDGLSVLKSLRQRKTNLPVMILTARNRVEDRVQCLDSGADDYLVKPFSFLELSARARALLRRSHQLLEYLMRNSGRRLTRAMIIEHVWKLPFDSTTNVVDVYINYLRREVDDGFSPSLIHTVRGVGYQMSTGGALA